MTAAQILDEMEVNTDPFAVCELRGRCDMGMGRLPGACLHYVISGQGEIAFNNRHPLSVQAGSLVLVPAFEFHTLRGYGVKNGVVPECYPAELGLAHHIREALDHEPSDKLIAICSRIHVTLRGSQGLVDLVRDPLVENIVVDDAMTVPMRKIVEELSQPRLGSNAMIQALMLECMIELFRKRLLSNDPTLTWISALSEERLWASLQVMLDRPDDPHSVESLAHISGMSRSTFAKYFSKTYGAGPMDLLQQLRMKKAAMLLTDTNLPIKRIAEMVGFHSRSAFNRAFASCNSKPPREFRAEMRERIPARE